MPSMELATLRVEPEQTGDVARVETQRGPRQCGRPVRADRQPPVQVPDPVGVAQQRPGVREQVVRQQDRLRVLQMGAARHRHAEMGARLLVQRLDHPLHLGGDVPECAAQVEPDQGGDLVVAGATGPQPPAELWSDPFDESTLERTVHVLVGRAGPEVAGDDVGLQRVQSGEHPGQLVVGQQPGTVQRPTVGPGAGQVVPGQSPVELGRLAEREHGLGRSAGEPAAPQSSLVLAAVARCRLRHDLLSSVGWFGCPSSVPKTTSGVDSGAELGWAVRRCLGGGSPGSSGGTGRRWRRRRPGRG